MKNLAIFVTGVAVGSVITYKLVEKRFKDIADEEINSVIETFKKRQEELEGKASKKKSTKKDTKKKDNKEYNEKVDYTKKVKDLDYADSEEDKENEKPSDEDCTIKIEPTEEDHIQIYQINDQDFGEELGYGTKSYTYYADGVLADEVDDIVADTTLVIPDDLLNKFIKDENADAIYVRDEDNEMDYEVLKETKTFSEINEGVSN